MFSKREELVDQIEKKIISNLSILKNNWLNPIKTNTKHFFLDDLLPENVCKEIYKSFPKDPHDFKKLKSFREKKNTIQYIKDLDDIIEDIIYAFQDNKIIKLISEITDIQNLIADPHLYAGGISMMRKGDFLNPHIDNSHDKDKKNYRRLNLLFYVSPDWKDEYGGNFELWDDRVQVPKAILSKFNRLIVMETNRKSWHSVNKVYVEGHRCCVSNYFFSKDSLNDDDYFHVTSFTGRPEEKMKRLISSFDNNLRNLASNFFGRGRGKNSVNIVSKGQ